MLAPECEFIIARNLNPRRVAIDEAQILPDIFPALAGEISLIFRRGDDRHVLGSSFGSLSNRLHHDASGFARELLPVIGEETVVAEIVPELLQGRRDVPLGLRRLSGSGAGVPMESRSE